MNDAMRDLSAIKGGEPHAAEELLPLVYNELRQLAAQQMAWERPGQTLQATALVNEAYLRLMGGGDVPWANRRHFFAAAAEAMRRILIDRARRRLSRGKAGFAEREDLKESRIVAASPSEEMLAVHEALDRLAAEDGQAGELVKLRYFAGMTLQEAARVLGLSLRNTERLWAFARAWLRRELERK